MDRQGFLTLVAAAAVAPACAARLPVSATPAVAPAPDDLDAIAGRIAPGAPPPDGIAS